MKRKIEVTKQVRATIADTFKVTTQAVGQALHFKINSVKAIRIREMALANGGILLEEKPSEHKPVKVLDSHGNVKQVI